MRYTVRPISDRTWLGSMGAEPTRFSAKWSATLELLEREVAILKGRDVVLEIDVAERDLRLDGTLRANASPSSRAVALAFESKHGPLMYRCDRFFTNWAHQGPEWQHNVRAIALKLEALRAVDRYGATESGEQYTGFKALPAGRAMPASHMTRDQALAVIAQAVDVPVEHLNTERESLVSSCRRARRLAHPDKHDGDHTMWHQVELAFAELGVEW